MIKPSMTMTASPQLCLSAEQQDRNVIYYGCICTDITGHLSLGGIHTHTHTHTHTHRGHTHTHTHTHTHKHRAYTHTHTHKHKHRTYRHTHKHTLTHTLTQKCIHSLL